MENNTAQTQNTEMPHILVVDDEPDIRHLVQEILVDEGYHVEVAENGDSARLAYRKRPPNLILLDIWMPDVDGITLLKEWSEEGSLTMPVIMMSGHGTVETAVEATRLGAFDFIEKPLSLAKLLLTIDQALESDNNNNEPNIQSLIANPNLIEPIGRSSSMQRLREQIKRIAEHESWVLLHGEAGSGVKLAAHYLHANSLHSKNNFIEINLSSLSFNSQPEEFVGSPSTKGLLAKAQGGTLYLRNIDEADDVTQNFLLNLLQSSSYQHLNSTQSIPFSARIICSTHNNIDLSVEQNKFRKDLFYLINVVPLHIPPLRDHREDIPDLLNYYTNLMVEQENLPYRHFSLAAQNRLRNYEWFGNIREFTNLIQRLLITASGNEINLDEVESAIDHKENVVSANDAIAITYDLTLREARELFERDFITHHLIQSGGSVGKVAKLIGMERTHLYRKLRSLNIDPKTLFTDKT